MTVLVQLRGVVSHPGVVRSTAGGVLLAAENMQFYSALHGTLQT